MGLFPSAARINHAQSSYALHPTGAIDGNQSGSGHYSGERNQQISWEYRAEAGRAKTALPGWMELHMYLSALKSVSIQYAAHHRLGGIHASP